MRPAHLSNYGPDRGPRAMPVDRPDTTQNPNGPGRTKKEPQGDMLLIRVCLGVMMLERIREFKIQF
jgi:hypothetical protein